MGNGSYQDNFYVDDMLKSFSTEEEAVKISSSIKEALAEGGFNLRKFLSNSKRVLQAIAEPDRKEIKSLELDDNQLIERTLGVQWYVEEDKLGFIMNEVHRKDTRRNILSTMSSIYDPLGLLAPFILRAKILLQQLCKEKLSWDEDVPAQYRSEWDGWLQEFPLLTDLKVNRCYKPEGFGTPTRVEIHHFADASEQAYGCVSYIRYQNSQEKVHCAFLIAKARVAPVKPITIPRLELTAATVAVRVNSMILRELQVPVDGVHYWTDSQTVLRYIHNDKTRFRTFVANRIGVIREGSHVSQWHYVDTSSNPADDASRGMTIKDMLKRHRWFQGPEFLWNNTGEWPHWHNNKESGEPQENDTEVRKSSRQPRTPPAKKQIEANTVKTTECKDSQDSDCVTVLMTYYSSWTRLKRAVGWWLHLKRILLRRARKQPITEESNFLSIEEINEAKEAIVKYVQQKAYGEEIQNISNDPAKNTAPDPDQSEKSAPQRIHKASSLAHLDPVLSKGILVVGGRLTNAPISDTAKHQWILPKDHHVTELLIRHAHVMCNHQGKNHVMSELRRHYWIVKGGVAVKQILSKCTICRRQLTKTSIQKMADMPASRVKPGDPPFTFTGMDYFGPFEVKVGRSIKKRYGVIFTCMNSRAVHIEIAECLDTSSCINALRRFVCRRGSVKEITSDNGTNLCAADRELRQAIQELDQEKIHTWAVTKEISWRFNPPTASHYGGVWERIIRSIRRVLQAILREQHVKVSRSEEQLQTVICEVENTINNRPLTRVSDEPGDLEVITPNHLLQPRNQEYLPPGNFTKEDNYARLRWRQVQYMADLFWKRWVQEYLPTLQRRQKWLHPKRNYQIGDIVLIADPQAPRNSWPMGRIEDIHRGSQGYVRSVTIKTKTAKLVRPITKLCLLLEQDS